MLETPLPAGWTGKKFKYLATASKGRLSQEAVEKASNDDGHTPYLSMEYLRGLAEPQNFVPVNDETVLAEDGDILLLWDGSNAGEFLVGKKGAVSSTTALIAPKGVNASYFFYTCKAVEDLIRSETVGMGIPHVNPDFLRSLKLPLPPSDEQERIARFLDRETSCIDALIAAKERLLELLAEKRRALITQAVTKGLDPNAPMRDSGLPWLGEIPRHWEIQRLKYIAEIELSNVDKHSVEGEQVVLLCNYMDVYKNERITSSMAFMEATATSEQIRRLSLQKSDVIITKDSETPDDIGVPAIVSEDLDRVVCGYHLALLRPHSHRIEGEFLLRAIQAESTKGYFFMEAVGMTRWGLGKQSIADLPVPVPSLDEQDRIVQHIDQQLSRIERLRSATERTILILRERRSALIAAAVTGKIDVRQHNTHQAFAEAQD